MVGYYIKPNDSEYSFIINLDENPPGYKFKKNQNSVTPIPTANRTLKIYNFKGFLREIKIWNTFMAPGSLVSNKLHRKVINSLL